jgi:hypothetical protein
MKSTLTKFSFAKLCVVSLFCTASGFAAIACGGDDNAQTTTTNAGGSAGDMGTGGSAGSGTGGTAGSAGSGTGGSAGDTGTGGTGGSGGSAMPDGGGTGGTGGAGGGDGGVAMGKKKQAFAIVAAGNQSKSTNYTLISTMSQGPGMNGSSKSTNFRLNLGVVGATQ